MFQLVKSLPLDLTRISVCHQKCFPSSFSSKLGSIYVHKTLEWFLVAPNRFLFHIESGNKVVGYCGGFRSSYTGDGSTSGMLQYAMREAIKGVIRRPLLLFHPELVKRYPLLFKNIYSRIFKPEKKGTV